MRVRGRVYDFVYGFDNRRSAESEAAKLKRQGHKTHTTSFLVPYSKGLAKYYGKKSHRIYAVYARWK